MRLPGIVLNITLLAGLAFGGAQSNFDPEQSIWTLTNGWIRASFQLTPEGFFLTQGISDLQSGDEWTASGSRPTSPVRLQADSDMFDAQTQYVLVAEYAQRVNPGGITTSMAISTFDTVTGASNARVVQITARLSF